MNKFNNYVYYTICEISLKYFEKSGFKTYSTFCKLLAISIKDDHLSLKEAKFMAKLIDEIMFIYALDGKSAGDYVCKFFFNEKYLIFETPVRNMKYLYPYS